MAQNDEKIKDDLNSNKGSNIFVSKHSICRNWSEIQCKTYANVFETVGQTILSKDYDSEDSYSIEVAKPDQVV